MRTILSKTILLIALVSFVTEGCNKYPEGPAFTLRSKEKRLANNWGIEKYMEDGVDRTDYFNTTYPGLILSIGESGTYAYSYTGFSESGTWRLVNDGLILETLSNISGATPVDLTILRLKDKSFWYYDVNQVGIRREYHFKPH